MITVKILCFYGYEKARMRSNRQECAFSSGGKLNEEPKKVEKMSLNSSLIRTPGRERYFDRVQSFVRFIHPEAHSPSERLNSPIFSCIA
jgi:hypothetical protein